ncbi:MAG: hypothetical protein AAGA58_00275 [Verrucomicrobiota bacterium]
MNYPTRAVLFLLLGGLCIFLLQREENRGTFTAANRAWIDGLLSISEQQIREPSVTFLKIDDQTREMLEAEGPLGPLDYALLCKKLSIYSPKVAAIEPVLAWEGEPELALNSLKTATLELDALLLGCELEDNPVGADISGSILDLFPSITNVQGDLSGLPSFTGSRSLPDLTLRILGNIGFIRIDLSDVDGDEEDALLVPLLAINGGRVVPSFVLQAVMLENDVEESDVRAVLGDAIYLGDDLRVPIDARGRLTVFSKLRGALPVHDADILIPDPAAIVDEDAIDTVELTDNERKALEERVVLIGLNDERLRSIPLDGSEEKISPAELSALAIATVQSGRYIRKLATPQQAFIWTALLLAGLGLLAANAGTARILWFVLVIVFLISSLIAFKVGQFWQPPIIPAALVICIFVSVFLPRKPTAGEETNPEDDIIV